jgi:enamine deaminase RidA (YjgF/YER057c/UK114 family)
MTDVKAQAIQRINPPGLATPTTYSHVVRVGNTLYIAGQVGADASGKVVGPAMTEQLEQVLKNLQTALKSQGADFANVVRITIYTTDVDAARTPEAAAIRAKYFAKNLPASTLVRRDTAGPARITRSRSKRRQCSPRDGEAADSYEPPRAKRATPRISTRS